MIVTKKWFVVCLVALSMMIVSAAPSSAGKIKSFSADQVTLAPGGQVENSTKLYITPDKMRMDMHPPQGEGDMIMILRQDRDIQWTLNPNNKAYVEKPLNQKEWEQMAKGMIKSTDEKDLGTEKVNGFKCRKKSVEMVIEVMGYKTKTRSIVWISKQLDIPIRTQSEDGRITELRNIKKGKQPSKLFTVPGGYKKVANMMELFSGPGQGNSGGMSIPEGLSDKLKNFKFPKNQ